ncbi:hypothetical protein CC86DRAFT_361597 [Ophiobolus disseminans]|uniref:Uncharacterized protein n=1 Tax=Ophiobolus disseminans TaxID=1469910 RepID=A0A6A6ZII3_9PLEO|nr:hypothetical protein CC86DRAFT_361597 [Ophiobolus disseminans]
MWVPNRAAPRVQRTSSVHSVASVQSNTSAHAVSQPKPSIISGRSDQADRLTHASFRDDQSDSGSQDLSNVSVTWPSQRLPTDPAHIKPAMGPTKVIRHPANITVPSSGNIQKNQWESATDDGTSSRSSTLDGEDDYMESMEKKTTAISKLSTTREIRNEEPRSPIPASHIPGPLESQLAALMSKLIYLEHANPAVSISPEEHEGLRTRLTVLEDEKRQWWKRHEAIWALRDEDVENNIKIRGLLAKCRRELDMTKTLRDEDLNNVQIVRAKLAEKTRELDRLQAQNGRVSPHRGRPGSYFERRGTSDLFVAAKTAALEQRALELEKRNSDLVAQVETLRGGANIDDLNRFTAHQAWKDTVGDLEARVKAKDAELTRLRAGTASSGGGMDWSRAEAVFEEHANYREAVGGKLQALRSDKEALQKELHRRENDCQALELRLQSLQRRSAVL